MGMDDVYEMANRNSDQSYWMDNEIQTCKWHDKIQSFTKEIEELLTNHELRVLTDDQIEEDEKLIEKFVKEDKKGPTMWNRIENFYSKPAVFYSRNLQIHVEDDIKRKNPTFTDDQVCNEMNNLIINIEDQIREDFKRKKENIDLSDIEIENKVREVKVKGYLKGNS